MVRASTSNDSFDEQWKALRGTTDRAVLRNAHLRPSKEAQGQVPGAKLVPFTDGIYAKRAERPLLAIEPSTISRTEVDWRMKQTYYQRWWGFFELHVFTLLGFYYYLSWRNVALGAAVFVLTNISICSSYHRLLTHRSFKTYKWLEYFFAWLGAQAGQGGPIEWVSNHRYHHLHTDTPLDPHSPYEGFWWSHMGWLIDSKACVERPYLDHSNVPELTSQPFYRFLESTWFWQAMIRQLLTYVFFGTDIMCWTMCFPITYGWHVTFLINSACHLWGYQTYNTGDLSTNNWVMGLLAGGEGWHNNHHAFQWSAAHGLEWWEFDANYCLIRLLEAVGLAWDVQVPTKKQKAAKRKQRGAA